MMGTKNKKTEEIKEYLQTIADKYKESQREWEEKNSETMANTCFIVWDEFCKAIKKIDEIAKRSR